MKKLILFILGLVFIQTIAAQNGYNPLVEEGKVWYFKGFASYVDDSYKVWEEIYSLEGDTVIDSHRCLKLYITCNSPYKSYDHAYIGAMYEKRRKVYYILPGNTTSTLLYDFSCDVGDIVKMNLYDIYMPTVVKWDEYELKINDKQIVKYRDEYLTVMNWNPLCDNEVVDYYCTIWIESVGSPIDLLNSITEWGTGGISKALITCKLNDQIIYSTYDFDEYYPEPEKRCFIKGSKWTEIRLDTLKYDNWYSKVGDEWVPNFETVEYYVKPRSFYYQGHTCNEYVYLYNVYTNGSNWTDSLSFVLYEYHTEDDICIKAYSHYSEAQAYQFNWFVGKELYYQNIVPFISSAKYPYGTIEEIKEGDFGGVRPLKYVDFNGVRIIQGIGVTEWNDGECLFGPVNLYRYSSSQGVPPERHYRSMLVHFERGDEVLYDVWPEKGTTGIECPLLHSDEGIATSKLFDLQGRKLPGKPARGIYIEDGKKVMGK